MHSRDGGRQTDCCSHTQHLRHAAAMRSRYSLHQVAHSPLSHCHTIRESPSKHTQCTTVPQSGLRVLCSRLLPWNGRTVRRTSSPPSGACARTLLLHPVLRNRHPEGLLERIPVWLRRQTLPVHPNVVDKHILPHRRGSSPRRTPALRSH